MQQNSTSQSSPLLAVPAEVLSMILLETMRSDQLVHMEHFLEVGRKLESFRNGVDFRAKVAKSSESACVELFFLAELDKLASGQKQHFLDFILVNSTCHALRAAGKRAFFSGKIFVISPQFLRELCKATPRISAENLAMAMACIRHVIAPIRNVDSPGGFITLPRYHMLQSLRLLHVRIGGHEMVVDSSVNLPTLRRHPLPTELSGLLGEIGLRVDQIKVDIQYDTKNAGEGLHELRMELLPIRIYPFLRLLAARKATGKI
ncbi:hypothetical protein MMC07_004331 [Pseudocyphellaria aurata]|nr:hypothetical protein [Pseudocyphellaria aurata]